MVHPTTAGRWPVIEGRPQSTFRAAARGAVIGLLFASVGCGAPSVRGSVAEYRTAVTAGDVNTVARLHSRRRGSSTETLAVFRRDHPDLWKAAVQQLDTGVSEVRLRAEVRLTSGARLLLVYENGAWRVEEGPLAQPRTETPEAALMTLANGVRAVDLDAVRAVIPESAQARFATDGALRAYIERIRARVFAAVDRIGPIVPGLAEIVGRTAVIAYEGGRQVRFVQEAKRWRVLDVE